MYIFGIDPGLKGGIAAYHKKEKTMCGCIMPIVKGEIDIGLFASMLVKGSVAYVEQVHSMPAQGVSSTFTFGKGYGKILGALEAHGIAYVLVTPLKWKKAVFVDYDKDDYGGSFSNKQMAIDHVSHNWPSVDLTPGRKRIPSDGISDAVCICEYGLIQEGLME